MSVSVKYSVIIPVYNAEKTLDRCIQSLLDQNYPHAEIILVNDGSTDQSGQICRTYADSYDNVIYIEKQNGGVSSARNAGLDIATGEFVLFVDSDDYVSEQYFVNLDTLGAHWDYVLFSFFTTDGKQVTPSILQATSAADVPGYFINLGKLFCSKAAFGPCNKRYKRSIIHNACIRFSTQLSIGEDALFNLHYALCCRSCCVSEEPLYYVSLENEQSLSRKVRDDVTEQLALCEQEMLLAVHGADISEDDRKELLKAIYFLRLREVYSESKRMHIRKIPLSTRLRTTRSMCDTFVQQNVPLPDRISCKLLWLPVKLRLAPLIDLVGWKLAH